ncbi:hypothetical protein CRG98_000198 [Punica granatum]|uniref:Uncharacterized protein n=1 Tax=Punica granatum TaxID=22663 RepID=A0A2I0LFK0_PUNGR|nr:hypothetical protein CRG98_000198 [Punica granatum]
MLLVRSTIVAVPEVGDVLADVPVFVCGDRVGPSCVDGHCRDSSGTQADSMDYSSKPGWRMAWSSCKMHGFSTTEAVLRKDEGSRLKGVNSLKSGGDLWGPNRRSNRATYPYSEPLSNMCFLKSVVVRDP